MAHNKYIRVRVRPDNMEQTVFRVDVSHLNKEGIYAEWDRIDDRYPKSKYISCLETTTDNLPCFEKEKES